MGRFFGGGRMAASLVHRLHKRVAIVCSGRTAAPPNLRLDFGSTDCILLLAYSANILASMANTSF